jgi:hypothetical protein
MGGHLYHQTEKFYCLPSLHAKMVGDRQANQNSKNHGEAHPGFGVLNLLLELCGLINGRNGAPKHFLARSLYPVLIPSNSFSSMATHRDDSIT